MQPVKPPNASFGRVIRDFWASPKFASLAPSSQSAYRYLLGLAEREETLGHWSVEVIRPSLVQAFLDGIDSVSQKHNALSALRALERWAVVRDRLPRPITTGCEAPASDGGYAPWTDEQVAYAEQHAPPHWARVVTLAANTGQRGSDLVRMRWSDIEEHEGRPGINVTQHKTGVQLWIPMTQELIRAVETWERRPTFLLLRKDGTPWPGRGRLSKSWLIARDRLPELKPLAEAGCVLHGLRAYAVVRLRRAGATTGQIKDMIGMSEQMVDRYCRLSVQRENALAAVHYLDTKIPRANALKNKV